MRQSRHTIRNADRVQHELAWIERRLKWLADNDWPAGGVEVVIRPASHSRSVQQNNLSHEWYSIVAQVEGEHTDEEVKCLCKLHCGVPILRGENPDFNEFAMFALDPLTYEQRVKAMLFTPVTSLMTVAQMSRYLEAVQRNYAKKGIRLESTNES